MSRYWVFRFAGSIIPRVPVALSQPVARLLGWLIWMFASGTRRRVERNLRHIPELATDPARLHAAACGVFQHMALNYLDFFRGASISDAELTAGWTIENQDAFEAVMAEGRGLIIFSGHLGNFELGASRLGALGYSVIAPAEHMEPEAVFQLFCRLREHHRLRLVPAESRDSLRELLDALKRGEIVVFVADRYVVGASTEVPFFGEPARLPTGPFALALRSGAPVMAVFSWREGPGRSHGVFTRLDLDASRHSSGVADVTTAVRSSGPTTSNTTTAATTTTRARSSQEVLRVQRLFLDELERRIAAHPEQWVSALTRVWEDT